MRDQIDLINRIKIILPRQILFDTLIATNHDRLRMDSVKQSLDLGGYHIGDRLSRIANFLNSAPPWQ